MASRLIAAASTKPALTTNLTNGTQDGITKIPRGGGSRRLTRQSARLTRAKLASVIWYQLWVACPRLRPAGASMWFSIARPVNSCIVRRHGHCKAHIGGQRHWGRSEASAG